MNEEKLKKTGCYMENDRKGHDKVKKISRKIIKKNFTLKNNFHLFFMQKHPKNDFPP